MIEGTKRLDVVGYVRVSTDEQAQSGAGLIAQREAIRAEAQRRGWRLISIFEDAGVSAKSLRGRPGLQAAVTAVEGGEAFALVVAKLDRLSRSVADFAALMERSRGRGWALVALDVGVDTTTPAGEVMANVVAAFSQYERRLISQRTRDALAAKRKQGVRLGRPVSISAATLTRIRRLRNAGQSFSSIATTLNIDGIPTAQGGAKWHPSTIQTVLARVEARSLSKVRTISGLTERRLRGSEDHAEVSSPQDPHLRNRSRVDGTDE